VRNWFHGRHELSRQQREKGAKAQIMARLRQLEKTLGKMFKAPAKKKSDLYRRQREEAKRLAAIHNIEIERMGEGGMNVWAPAAIADTEEDPFYGDHFASNWDEAVEMVKKYAELVPVTS
jgi:hypothetical protein